MCIKTCHCLEKMLIQLMMMAVWKSKHKMFMYLKKYFLNEAMYCYFRLEKLVQIERTEFLLLIKTLSYILKRASTFIMKPSKLQSELKEKLQLQDSKIDVIMKLWIKNMKPILDNLENKDVPGQSNQLEHVGWKMKLQISSEPQQKEKIPIAQIQLHTSIDNVNGHTGEPINFEMNHVEVLELYNTIEAIQNELDTLRNTK